MIAHLRGVLAAKQPDQAVVEAGGVGYRVFIPLSTYQTLPLVGEGVVVQTVTQVREDAFHLYGFATREEKEMFLLLIGVAGIGGRLALSALSCHTPEALARAVVEGDNRALARIAGVGPKMAERLVVELRDKVGGFGGGVVVPVGERPGERVGTFREELGSALVNLGYKPHQVEPVVRRVLSEAGGELAMVQALRLSLKLLAPG